MEYSEESQSEHSFEFNKPFKAADTEYISTSLIVGEDLHLNDIEISRMVYSEIEKEVKQFTTRRFIWKRKSQTLDPRLALKDAKAYGEVETMVDHEEIPDLV